MHTCSGRCWFDGRRACWFAAWVCMQPRLLAPGARFAPCWSQPRPSRSCAAARVLAAPSLRMTIYEVGWALTQLCSWGLVLVAHVQADGVYHMFYGERAPSTHYAWKMGWTTRLGQFPAATHTVIHTHTHTHIYIYTYTHTYTQTHTHYCRRHRRHHHHHHHHQFTVSPPHACFLFRRVPLQPGSLLPHAPVLCVRKRSCVCMARPCSHPGVVGFIVLSLCPGHWTSATGATWTRLETVQPGGKCDGRTRA